MLACTLRRVEELISSGPTFNNIQFALAPKGNGRSIGKEICYLVFWEVLGDQYL